MKIRSIRPTAKIRRKKPPVKLQATASRAASRRSRVEEYDDEDEYADYEATEPNMKLSHAFIVVLLLHLIAVAGVFGFNSMKNRQNALAKIAAEAAVGGAVAGEVAEASATTSGVAGASPAAGANAVGAARTHEVVPGDTLTRIAARYETSIEAIEKANGLTADSILRVGQVLNLPEPGAAPVAATPSAPASVARTTAPAPTTTVANTAAPAATGTASTTTNPAPAPAASTANTTTASAPAAPSGTADVYEVVAGDNPYSIARRLGVSYQDLLTLNSIDDPTKLQIGQQLKIPAPR
jgi:LysM repeat protein